MCMYNVNTHTDRYSLTKPTDKGAKALILTDDILESWKKKKNKKLEIMNLTLF